MKKNGKSNECLRFSYAKNQVLKEIVVADTKER